MAGTHSNQTDNHRPHRWIFANAGARAAMTGYAAPTVNDVGKWALQSDDGTFWWLSDDSPVTWTQVIATAAIADGSITISKLAFDPATQTELDTHIAVDATQTVKGHVSYEMIQDMLSSVLVGSTHITVTYDDTANTYTFTTDAMVNPMTTPADIIVGGTSGAPTRLAKGSDGQVLTVDPTTHLLVWATPSGGGLTNPMTTAEDIIVGGSSGTPTRLAAGSNGTFLGVVSGALAWATPSGGGGGGGGGTNSDNLPLNQVSLHGTYGDDFTGTSLDAKWTRHDAASGFEAFQYPSDTEMHIDGTQAGNLFWLQTAPAGDFEIILAFKALEQDNAIVGPAILDGSGNGVMSSINSDDNQYVWTIGSYTLGGGAVNSSRGNVARDIKRLAIPMWIGIAKISNTYKARVSFNGITWSAYTSLTSGLSFTPAVIGFGRIFTTNVPFFTVDRFNVI